MFYYVSKFHLTESLLMNFTAFYWNYLEKSNLIAAQQICLSVTNFLVC